MSDSMTANVVFANHPNGTDRTGRFQLGTPDQIMGRLYDHNSTRDCVVSLYSHLIREAGNWYTPADFIELLLTVIEKYAQGYDTFADFARRDSQHLIVALVTDDEYREITLGLWHKWIKNGE